MIEDFVDFLNHRCQFNSNFQMFDFANYPCSVVIITNATM